MSFLNPLLKYVNRVSIVEESRIVRQFFDKDSIKMVEGANLYLFENGRRRQHINIYSLTRNLIFFGSHYLFVSERST